MHSPRRRCQITARKCCVHLFRCLQRRARLTLPINRRRAQTDRWTDNDQRALGRTNDFDLFTTTAANGSSTGQKKGYVAPERRGHFGKTFAGPVQVPSFICGEQYCGSVGGSSAQTRLGRDAFGKRDYCSARRARHNLQSGEGFVDQVVLRRGQGLPDGGAAGVNIRCPEARCPLAADIQFAVRRRQERQRIVDGNCEHQRLEFMKPIRPTGKHFQREINLRGRMHDERRIRTGNCFGFSVERRHPCAVACERWSGWTSLAHGTLIRASSKVQTTNVEARQGAESREVVGLVRDCTGRWGTVNQF